MLIREGDGALMTDENEKKTSRDFALWKKSKPGEPSWKSPWGYGRPGWHIECSTMASHILGNTLDIHTGGEDLKFPHHDNEMAQSSGYFYDKKTDKIHPQWVNYWFHAGHLHISGLKMSKSLKNFISIREALNGPFYLKNDDGKYVKIEYITTKQIRLMFLLQSWDGKMNFSYGTI
eukprot:762665_1